VAYERGVPHVDITAELVCMWFDDQYHPGEQDFESCFSATELAALAEFNRFHDIRVKELPDSQGSVLAWLASPIWREVMDRARETLEFIVPSRSSPADE